MRAALFVVLLLCASLTTRAVNDVIVEPVRFGVVNGGPNAIVLPDPVVNGAASDTMYLLEVCVPAASSFPAGTVLLNLTGMGLESVSTTNTSIAFDVGVWPSANRTHGVRVGLGAPANEPLATYVGLTIPASGGRYERFDLWNLSLPAVQTCYWLGIRLSVGTSLSLLDASANTSAITTPVGALDDSPITVNLGNAFSDASTSNNVSYWDRESIVSPVLYLTGYWDGVPSGSPTPSPASSSTSPSVTARPSTTPSAQLLFLPKDYGYNSESASSVCSFSKPLLLLLLLLCIVKTLLAY